MISATLPCMSKTPKRERQRGNEPEGSVFVAQVAHAVVGESGTQLGPKTAAGLFVLQTSRSGSLPYEYLKSGPPAGSPAHAKAHSSSVQRRLPWSVQTSR